MSSPSLILMRGHPGWSLRPGGVLVRLLATGAGTWYARWDGRHLALTALDREAASRPEPSVQATGAGELPYGPKSLTAALAELGTVLHLPTPDLWDTLTAQILRSASREPRAHRAYHAWAASHGTRHETPDGPLYAIPRPQQILTMLPSSGRAPAGSQPHLAFLAGAAAAYLRHHSTWETMTAPALTAALRQVRGLGKRSAAIASADYTGNYALYRADDPTLIASARQAAGHLPQQQHAFAELWHHWTPRQGQRHALNLFTLAHAHHTALPSSPSAQPATIPPPRSPSQWLYERGTDTARTARQSHPGRPPPRKTGAMHRVPRADAAGLADPPQLWMHCSDPRSVLITHRRPKADKEIHRWTDPSTTYRRSNPEAGPRPSNWPR